MSRVYLNFDGKDWHEVDKSDFSMEKTLLQRLDNLKLIQKKKWDGVILIDGPERAGKSSLALQCAWYLSDQKVTINNFALGLYDAAQKIAEIPEGSVLIVDEGSTVFSSRQANNKAQQALMQILDVVGQKRIIFIIVLPCFFDLNKTIAVRRSKFLLHVYPNERYDRGQFLCWGEKSKGKLYRIGKKNYDSYEWPKADDAPSQYSDWHPPFWAEYEEKVKKVTLARVLQDAQTKESPKLKEVYKKAIKKYQELFPLEPQWKIAQILDITQAYISQLSGDV